LHQHSKVMYMEEYQNQTEVKDDIVIRFSGDSGDGMQLTGTLFSETAAFTGNDLLTFPDFPAEIRAPQNTPVFRNATP